MKSIAFITYADARPKDKPVMVVLINNNTLTAAGDPDTYAVELADGLAKRFGQMDNTAREIALMQYVDTQRNASQSAARVEAVDLTSEGQRRVNKIMNDFIKRRSDRVLKKS